MIPSPIKRRVPGTPKQFKALLIAFTIRQIASLAILGWLLAASLHAGGTFWILMAAITVAFVAFAVYGWLRLHGQYVRSLQHAAAREARI